MYILRITWPNRVRRASPVGIADTANNVVDVDNTGMVDLPSAARDARVRRIYKNKYPDSLYVTIWILYGAGIET